jgi:hypothetical protein
MATDSAIPTRSASQVLIEEDRGLARRTRFGHLSESAAVQGIIDVAMVGLIGGGPRLAIRAARVVLEDRYGSRSSARQGQMRAGRARRRGG